MSWAIETRQLTKYYPANQGWRNLLAAIPSPRPAVSQVDLCVRHGELFGLLGPNGAGKTTLIKMLCTLVLPTSGKALVNGYGLSQETAVKKSIGLAASDERSFYWRLSGRQNLRFFATLYHLPERIVEQRIDEVLEMVQLQGPANQRFLTYSTGMRQRLSIARALLTSRILFLDEPTKGLDPKAVRLLHELIRSRLTLQEGITVFLTTHILAEAEQLCDRVAVMHQGAIQGCGSITELRSLLGLQERYFLQVAGLNPAGQQALQTELPPGSLISAPAELYQTAPADTAQVEVVSSDDNPRLDRAIEAVRARGGIIQAVWRDQASLETIFNTLTATEKRSIPSVAAGPGEDILEREPETQDLRIKPVDPLSRLNFLILNLWRIPKAFLKRDFLDESSYRFSFLIQFISIFMSAGMFFFIAKLVDQASITSLSALDGGYFPFALIGLAFSAYFSTGLTSFSSSLRQAQTTGTLEAMLTSPTQVSTIIISSSLWSYVITTFRALLYLLVGIVLGMDISHANLLSAVVILVLTIAAFNGIGILAASFIMVLKRGDPINWLINSLSSLLGGVYYPVQLLPAWLQPISKLIPLTYSLDALRKALLEGAPLTSLGVEILALLVFSCLLLPVSLAAFRFALQKARTDGSLTHY